MPLLGKAVVVLFPVLHLSPRLAPLFYSPLFDRFSPCSKQLMAFIMFSEEEEVNAQWKRYGELCAQLRRIIHTPNEESYNLGWESTL